MWVRLPLVAPLASTDLPSIAINLALTRTRPLSSLKEAAALNEAAALKEAAALNEAAALKKGTQRPVARGSRWRVAWR
jgi:hypothetical protein